MKPTLRFDRETGKWEPYRTEERRKHVAGKFTLTLEEKRQGLRHNAHYFPKRDRVIQKLYERRKYGKPIDGRCFKDAGDTLKYMKSNNIR